MQESGHMRGAASYLPGGHWLHTATGLLVVVGPAGWPDHDQQHCYHHAPMGKPEAATAVVELLMMGVRTPETCSAVNKDQDNKLDKLLRLVGDHLNYTRRVWFVCFPQLIR
jgi:hypothetical protein